MSKSDDTTKLKQIVKGAQEALSHNFVTILGISPIVTYTGVSVYLVTLSIYRYISAYSL